MSATYRCLESAELMEIEGEMLILNPETFSVTKLNATGGEIWRLLSDSRTIEELSEHLAAVYAEVPLHQIQEDVQYFVKNMQEIGLIQLAE